MSPTKILRTRRGYKGPNVPVLSRPPIVTDLLLKMDANAKKLPQLVPLSAKNKVVVYSQEWEKQQVAALQVASHKPDATKNKDQQVEKSNNQHKPDATKNKDQRVEKSNNQHKPDATKNKDQRVEKSNNQHKPDATKNKDQRVEKSNNQHSCVTECIGDLFEVEETVSLAHCVGADFKMRQGIAAIFRHRFNSVDKLLAQNIEQGGVAFMEYENRHIFYLVTKTESSGKPTYETMEKCLVALYAKCKELNVKQLAMPRIGCGLDRLDWKIVKRMLKNIFVSGIDIKVYTLGKERTSGQAEQQEQNQSRSQDPRHKDRRDEMHRHEYHRREDRLRENQRRSDELRRDERYRDDLCRYDRRHEGRRNWEPRREDTRREYLRRWDPRREDPRREDPRREDPRREYLRRWEPQREDPRREDPRREDLRRREPQREDPRREDPRREDLRRRDPQHEVEAEPLRARYVLHFY